MNVIAWLKKKLRQRQEKKYRACYGIDPNTVLLPGFEIMDDSESKKRLQIGRQCVLACKMIFETKDHGVIRIGDRCHIGGNTMLISFAGITLGDDVTIAWGCTIYDHDSHALSWEARKNDTVQEVNDYHATGNPIANKDWSQVVSRPIVIEDRAWLGFGVTVLKGVHIGEGSVIGAGSVVTRDVPPYCVAAGNPARVVKEFKKPKDRQ